MARDSIDGESRPERSSTSSALSLARHIRYVVTSNPVTLLAFVLLAIILLAAIAGPSLVPYDPL